MTLLASRGSPGLLGRWWRTVDRLNLLLLLLLAGVGTLMVMAASPPAAERLGYPDFHFVERHLAVLAVSLALVLTLSFLPPMGVLRASAAGLAAAIALLAATALWGIEVNGARRWLAFEGFTIQASEIAKPFLAVVAGWLFAGAGIDTSRWIERDRFVRVALAALLLAVVWSLVVLQPDFSTAMIIACAWCAQLFIAGLRIRLAFLVAAAGGVVVWAAYFLLPHVRFRIDRFLDPAGEPGFQVSAGLEAYERGGLLGQGPGAGLVKERIPDSHTDFIFPVIAEEFGFIACFSVLAVIALIAFRGVARLAEGEALFPLLAAAGLLVQFALQALVNISVTLDLVPTTGLTLPFVSVGGSSLAAVGAGMGFLLALTRRRVEPPEAGR